MKKNGKSAAILGIIIAVIVFFAFAGFKGLVIGDYQFKSFESVITRGLDLQGGVSVLMEIQKDDVTQEELDKLLENFSSIVVTEGIPDKQLAPGETASTNIILQRLLATSDDLAYENNGEIIRIQKTALRFTIR